MMSTAINMYNVWALFIDNTVNVLAKVLLLIDDWLSRQQDNNIRKKMHVDVTVLCYNYFLKI